MTALDELQDWYVSQCDGDWEHDFGVTIDTLDNPGWIIKIDLDGTDLEGRFFETVERFESEQDWIKCWIEGKKFHGVGDPRKLEPVLKIFLAWANSAS
jgi:hypothetical protein